MIGGFALIAYPAKYGDSGIKTFIVNHRGVVYEKDLGPATETLAPQIDALQSGQDLAGNTRRISQRPLLSARVRYML